MLILFQNLDLMRKIPAWRRQSTLEPPLVLTKSDRDNMLYLLRRPLRRRLELVEVWGQNKEAERLSRRPVVGCLWDWAWMGWIGQWLVKWSGAICDDLNIILIIVIVNTIKVVVSRPTYLACALDALPNGKIDKYKHDGQIRGQRPSNRA